MANQTIDINVRNPELKGKAIEHGYEVQCMECKSSKTAYWAYAAARVREQMEDGSFVEGLHHCPNCMVKKGISRSARVVRKHTPEEINKLYNLNKSMRIGVTRHDTRRVIQDDNRMNNLIKEDKERISYMNSRKKQF